MVGIDDDAPTGRQVRAGDGVSFSMIRVNDGQFEVKWKKGMTVQSLLQECKLSYPMLLVALNGRVVPPEKYAAHSLADGDAVMVRHLVSGG